MPNLLHIDASIQGERSISRRLSALAAERWRQAHPGGEVSYRDFAVEPPPHLGPDGALARAVPEEQRTPDQAMAFETSRRYVAEVRAADTIILGLPLYNFGPPSTVKAWVDQLIVQGLAMDMATGEPLLAGRELIVTASRGGGYSPGAPREGWDHAEGWLGHGLDAAGLEPRFITAELTLADVVPQMEELRPLAAASLRAAEEEIGGLWAEVPA